MHAWMTMLVPGAVVFDLLFAWGLFKLFFGSWAGFWDAMKESWLLSFTFFWNSDYYNREVANFMVELYFGLCGALVAGELYWFHMV